MSCFKNACSNPANLNKKIVIQTATETQSSSGEVSRTWATFANGWAMIKPLTGRELVSGDAVSGEVTHRIFTRYVAGVTPKMRVSYDSRTFEIVYAINSDEANRQLELLCKEAV